MKIPGNLVKTEQLALPRTTVVSSWVEQPEEERGGRVEEEERGGRVEEEEGGGGVEEQAAADAMDEGEPRKQG